MSQNDRIFQKTICLHMFVKKANKIMLTMEPFLFLRNIFQDVTHKDTLVKSFIDEVRLRHT